ncbi:MAG: tryptophan synthase subunit alpha [Balneolaceae bacterium]
MNSTSRRIQNLFKRQKEGDKVMSLFVTAGYPDIDSTTELVLGFEKEGADLIEIGIPYSDPLADGPTIQYSSQTALKNGITMDRIFASVREIRKSSEIPLILMGYINPILKRGIEKFCKEASESGIDGLIIPDVPPEESKLISAEASKNGLSLIYLVAPNTDDERMKEIDRLSEGFVYCVSVTGVTGARTGEELELSVSKFIDRVEKNVIRNPKLIGFGIRSHEDAKRITEKTDGFIVGSALIDSIRSSYPKEGWKSDVFKFVKKLKYGDT